VEEVVEQLRMGEVGEEGHARRWMVEEVVGPVHQRKVGEVGHPTGDKKKMG
jgi:hypothetical protein